MSSNKPSILMVTMAMDIGGAETHILELCKALLYRGYKVTLVSNGGVYVNEFEEAGGEHINAPLHERKVGSIIKSYKILKRVIQNFRPDIVHAHARIPGFVCGLLRKKIHFEFVTTAHWVFAASGMQGRLTNWGSKSMAVSEDIKNYLIENYDYSRENIYVTINGIDTDKFSPVTDGSAVRQEFKLDGKTVVHVSRLDKGRAKVAAQLIDAAPELAKKMEGIKLLIVGAGNMYDILAEKAKDINNSIGYDCIVMAGARTDINNLIAAGDIFVGVSRAALEAMSEAKPVIVAGDEGFIGTFTPEKFDIAWETNFCCRGCEESDKHLLIESILNIYNLDSDRIKELGDYCRSVVLDNYSVTKMTDDYENMYSSPVNKPCNILISGYYGYKNAGDDAILQSIRLSLIKLALPLNVQVLVHGDRIEIDGIKPVYRFSVFSLLRAIRDCDLLISGGGSLLQDKTSTRSLVYYLSIIRLAKLFNKTVLVYANGIGPVEGAGNRKRVKRAVSNADIITLREESSKNELLDMGLSSNAMHVTADPVFLLECPDKEYLLEKLRGCGVMGERPILGVSVRELDTDLEFRDNLGKLLDYAYEELGMDIFFIIMQTSNITLQTPNDMSISKDIHERMKNPSFIMNTDLSPEDIMGITGCMSVVLSMRLHTLIFAAKNHVPVIGIECDPKISYYQDILNMPSLGQPSAFDLEKAKIILADMMEDMESYQSKIEKAAAIMEDKAKDNEIYLKQAIDMCK